MRMTGLGSSRGPSSRRCTFMPAISTNCDGGGAQRALRASTGRSGAHVTAKKPTTTSASNASTPPTMVIVLLTTGFPEDDTLFARPSIQTDCDEIVKCGNPQRPSAAAVAVRNLRLDRSLG